MGGAGESAAWFHSLEASGQTSHPVFLLLSVGHTPQLGAGWWIWVRVPNWQPRSIRR